MKRTRPCRANDPSTCRHHGKPQVNRQQSVQQSKNSIQKTVLEVPPNDGKEYPVLVYGTLRPGGTNYENFLAGDTTSEENVQIHGFSMYSNVGYPYLTTGEGTVTATLVSVKPEEYDATMYGLDFLEGYRGEDPGRANHYNRRLATFTHEGAEKKAWIYVLPEQKKHQVSSLPHISGGDWLQYKEEAREAQRQSWLAAFLRDDAEHQTS